LQKNAKNLLDSSGHISDNINTSPAELATKTPGFFGAWVIFCAQKVLKGQMSRYCVYIDAPLLSCESKKGGLILPADSDLIPAIQAVHEYTPEKKVGVMFPIGRNNNDLKKEADFRIKMPQRLLEAYQFPEKIKVGNNPDPCRDTKTR